MNRIASGFYMGEYKGLKFTVTKVEAVDNSTRGKWYWMIGNVGGEDWFNSKSIAVDACKEYIDELTDNPHHLTTTTKTN